MVSAVSEERATRNPGDTRQRLLEAASGEIHRHGFSASSVERILAETGLTKGALYHHFESKTSLGYAVVEEIIREELQARWLRPLAGQDDPITAFRTILECAAGEISDEDLECGCPLNNIAQEMSPRDEGFRLRCAALYDEWRVGIANALDHGKRKNTVRADLDSAAAAVFIVAAMEGCIGLAKSARSLAVLRDCGTGLIQYLESLRRIS